MQISSIKPVSQQVLWVYIVIKCFGRGTKINFKLLFTCFYDILTNMHFIMLMFQIVLLTIKQHEVLKVVPLPKLNIVLFLVLWPCICFFSISKFTQRWFNFPNMQIIRKIRAGMGVSSKKWGSQLHFNFNHTSVLPFTSQICIVEYCRILKADNQSLLSRWSLVFHKQGGQNFRCITTGSFYTQEMFALTHTQLWAH